MQTLSSPNHLLYSIHFTYRFRVCEFQALSPMYQAFQRFTPSLAGEFDFGLPSDSALLRTPLPLSNASSCLAHSGFSPYSFCTCQAHLLCPGGQERFSSFGGVECPMLEIANAIGRVEKKGVGRIFFLIIRAYITSKCYFTFR